ncbi:MAG: hypothetical protein M5R36_07080 [Deltaproteobacteria bacterium]|nr:hypothetical protein [Deltaproteobacteria bacterium]
MVEQALLLFMEARRELPDEAFIPSRIVVGLKEFRRIVSMIENPKPPSKALRDLMRGRGD